jgi:cytochrome c oxidase assembly protein subunit 15
MQAERSSRWLNRFIWFTAAATLLLICSGGMVTSKGVGLAVPDWPTTFGYNMFLFPVSKWVGGIFFEHTHRLIASIVGFLTIILTVWIWLDEDRPWVRRLGLIALAAVILQGVLGGLRVTLLKDQIGVFHACLAQAFLGFLVFIGIARSNLWRSSPAKFNPAWRRFATFAVATTLLIYGQMALGATMRHEHKDLAILDFPTANHSWWPDTSAAALEQINRWRDARGLSDVTASQIWLQMAHRFGALLVTISIFLTVSRLWRISAEVSALRKLSVLWVILLLAQVTLGAWTIWSNKAADIATAHVAAGAAMLSLGVCLAGFGFRFSGNQTQTIARPAAAHDRPVFA